MNLPALLAFVDAGGTVDSYNAARTIDLPAEDVRTRAKAMGVLQRWQDAILSGQLPEALATHLMRTLAAFDSYSTINPASPTFGAVLAPIQAAGLVTAEEVALLVAMATTSQRAIDGWERDATDADVAAARAEQAQEQAAAALAAAKLAKNLAIDADRDRQMAPIMSQREARIAAVLAAGTVEAVNAIVVGE